MVDSSFVIFLNKKFVQFELNKVKNDEVYLWEL